ncbi:hypothetical protein V5O48_017282 [Marasmius crinis-equi]|uniref:F-box domain-containing protein n=1 Tax=Marasmius crinis-equi TaxID=585013 RepID=A0ABR3EPG3_9AGAR
MATPIVPPDALQRVNVVADSRRRHLQQHSSVPLQLRHNELPKETAEAEALQVFAKGEVLVPEKRNTSIRTAVVEGRLVGVEEKYQGRLSEDRTNVLPSWHTPMERVPPEIIEKIAHYVCLDDPRTNEWSGYTLKIKYRGGQHAPALVLGGVCHRWRVVVHSSRRLWSSIFIALDEITAKTGVIVNYYLERTGTGPLERLAIVDEEDDSTIRQASLRAILDRLAEKAQLYIDHVLRILFQHFDRVAELTVRSTHLATRDTTRFRTPSFPLLRSFTDLTIDVSLSTRTTIWSYLPDAPKLQFVELWEYGFRGYLRLLPYENLISLSITGLSYFCFLIEVLPECKQLARLRVCGIDQIEPPENGSGREDRISLPSLTHLHFEAKETPPHEFGELFLHFNLPFLTELSLVFSYTYRPAAQQPDDQFIMPEWANNLATMLEISSCRLTTLTLDTVFSSPPSVYVVPDILRSCPHLRCLAFKISGKTLKRQITPQFTIALATSLAPNAESPHSTLVPRLINLIIQEPLLSLDQRTVACINSFWDSRSEEGLSRTGLRDVIEPIETLSIDFWDFSKKTIEREWEEMKNLGDQVGLCVVKRLGEADEHEYDVTEDEEDGSEEDDENVEECEDVEKCKDDDDEGTEVEFED